MDGYHMIYPIDKCIDSIQYNFNILQNRIDYLLVENKKLKDEHFKDHELARQKEEIETLKNELNRGFQISEYENNLISEWIEKHEDSAREGCCGGHYTYEFTPTSLGCIGTVKCTCGEEFCFKDLD